LDGLRGGTPKTQPSPLPTRVRALESRSACEISFPGSRRTDVPTQTEMSASVGVKSVHIQGVMRLVDSGSPQ
jgi:hypothetical protein